MDDVNNVKGNNQENMRRNQERISTQNLHILMSRTDCNLSGSNMKKDTQSAT